MNGVCRFIWGGVGHCIQPQEESAIQEGNMEGVRSAHSKRLDTNKGITYVNSCKYWFGQTGCVQAYMGFYYYSDLHGGVCRLTWGFTVV